MSQQVKCERCQSTKPLGRWLKFEVDKVRMVEDTITGDPRFQVRIVDMGEKRGLCVECSEELAKREFDSKNKHLP